MKFLHTSDLHIGKRLNEFSLIEDQKYILLKIIQIADNIKPDGIIIAGDIYDKSIPSAEAVSLFDEFLYSLSRRNISVYAISGNHDSAERIAFGSRLMDKSNIYFSPVYNGNIKCITKEDEFGKINIYMLPFIKPLNVKRFFPEEEIISYTDAIKFALSNINIDKNQRNILVTHQFVTGASRSESEEISVGGSDNVDASVFEDFDYVALGHIHSPQKMTKETIRYCGTPLKYSFSECNDNKSVTVIEFNEKDDLKITTEPLLPLRDMREIKGKYEDIVLKKNYENTNTYDYMHITLTDEEDIPDAVMKLRVIYPNLMKLDYDNTRTRTKNIITSAENVENISPADHFASFYEKQNNQPMTDIQKDYIISLIEDVWGCEK